MIWWLLAVSVVVMFAGIGVIQSSNTAPTAPDEPRGKQRRERFNDAGYGALFVGWIGAGLSWSLAASSFWGGVWKFVVAFIAAVIVSVSMASAG